MEAFKVCILAADHPFYEGECLSLTVPTIDGQYGVLAHHSNMIGAVTPGELICRLKDKDPLTAAVSEGLIKIEKGEVLVLVDSAERPDEIDINRAKRDADKAKEALLHQKSRQEYLIAQANLTRALSRLRIKGHGSENT